MFKISRACNFMIVMIGMLFVSHTSAIAQTERTEDIKYIIVWDNNDGCVSFPLEEKPIFKYNIEESLVSCITTNNTIDIPLQNVHKYTLDNKPAVPTSIEETAGKEGKMSFATDMIYLRGFKAYTKVGVYTADGVLTDSRKADAQGCLAISMGNWTHGVYIIKVNNVTYKIYNK